MEKLHEYHNAMPPKSETVKLRFGSWWEYLEACEKQPGKIGNTHNSSRRQGGGFMGQGWNGTSNFEECLNLARNGWPEGTERAKAIAEAIFERVSSMIEVPEIRFDVTGQDFDMGLYTQGVPECWYQFENRDEQREGTRIVKLVFNISALADVSAEVMITKGAAAAALVQCLEFAGFRCEVVMATGVTGSGRDMETFTLVKPADQPLDMDRLTFALGNPATHRRLNFAIRETFNKWMDDNPGYGSSIEVESCEHGDLYVGRCHGYEPQFQTPEAAQRWIIEELKRQGVKLTEQ